MPSFTSDDVVHWLQRYADLLDQHKDRLTQLDSAIGDGDHGVNMTRGFNAVRGKLPSLADKDIGTIFKTTAMTLISTVGGASGPLYGTFFLQAAASASGKTELSHADLSTGLEAGFKGVVMRGKAAVGDKTMIDAMAPAVEALRPLDGSNDSIDTALTRAVSAARRGADSAIPLVARKGRASYLGERSAGHPDPGAESTVLLFEALAAVVGSPQHTAA